jgi:hypothetical protein
VIPAPELRELEAMRSLPGDPGGERYPWARFARKAEAASDLDHKTDLRVEQVGADRAAVFADVFSRADTSGTRA